MRPNTAFERKIEVRGDQKKKTTKRERGEEEKRDMGESDGGRESDEHKKR